MAAIVMKQKIIEDMFIEDINEYGLVDLADCGFIVEHDCFKKGWTDDPRCLSRENVADALVLARRNLPLGFNFKIYDGWRPLEIQEKAAKETLERLRKVYPQYSFRMIINMLQKFCPLQAFVFDLGSHRHGGALDLTIVDDANQELYMGSPINDVIRPAAHLLYFEWKGSPIPYEYEARENRRLLIRALGDEGFKPHLPEWWHWSYGDYF